MQNSKQKTYGQCRERHTWDLYGSLKISLEHLDRILTQAPKNKKMEQKQLLKGATYSNKYEQNSGN